MRHSIASAIALIALSPIAAAEPPRDDACTVLSPQAQAVQLGSRASSRYLLIEDGDTHYRLDLFRNASYAPRATPIRLVSNGQARTVCMHGRTMVKDADGKMFWVSRASAIDAGKFAQLTRKLAKSDHSGWQAYLGIRD